MKVLPERFYCRELPENAFYKFSLSAQKSQEAVLFLHGFPGDSGKNEDIAAELAKLELDSYLLHFKGLGDSEGQFTFSSSLKEASIAVKVLNRMNYSPIHLFGHSWGGMVALCVLHEMPERIGNVLLLAPVIKPPDFRTAESILFDYEQFNDGSGATTASGSELLLDYASVVQTTLPPELRSHAERIYAMHGQHDVVTSPDETKKFMAYLGRESAFSSVEQDHWFLNRRLVSLWAASIFLKSNHAEHN